MGHRLKRIVGWVLPRRAPLQRIVACALRVVCVRCAIFRVRVKVRARVRVRVRARTRDRVRVRGYTRGRTPRTTASSSACRPLDATTSRGYMGLTGLLSGYIGLYGANLLIRIYIRL